MDDIEDKRTIYRFFLTFREFLGSISYNLLVFNFSKTDWRQWPDNKRRQPRYVETNISNKQLHKNERIATCKDGNYYKSTVFIKYFFSSKLTKTKSCANEEKKIFMKA